ncbi:MAG: PfkB family carbohydrate kinase [bacterium]
MEKKNNKKILVCGSIVIDTIFDLNGTIRDRINISNGKLGSQNLSFSSSEKKESPGGNAGNISYGLALFGQEPILASVVGKDFDPEFRKYYEDLGINLRVYTDKDGYTSTFYVMTDENKEQIGVFQGNAFLKYNDKIALKELISDKEFDDIKVAIVSAQSAKATINKLKEINKIGKGKIFTIFDPGQELLTSFGKDLLAFKKAISLSNMVIANEVETRQIEKILDRPKKDIFSFGVKYFIETLGERGSILHTVDGSQLIKAKKVKKVVDPTGAGDAFRAGLIYGIINDKDIKEAVQIGSIVAAESVKYVGGQAYFLPRSLKKA